MKTAFFGLICPDAHPACNSVDEKIAAKEAGLDLRACTTSEIQKHLDDFGLAQEFGTYGKIRGLSGGQKVKLVPAAAMWNCPHLPYPTSALPMALGAFAVAADAISGDARAGIDAARPIRAARRPS